MVRNIFFFYGSIFVSRQTLQKKGFIILIKEMSQKATSVQSIHPGFCHVRESPASRHTAWNVKLRVSQHLKVK